MSLLKRAAIPLLILVTAVVYWFLAYEWAGTVLLLIFAIAMGVMIWALGRTLDDVGPTAPVDPDWHERQS
jgi:hypothetical protein